MPTKGLPISRHGRLWRLLAFVCLPLLVACGGQPSPHVCASDHIDERAQVDHIYDGDTVKLLDGRKLRFIGVDTPEIGHRHNPSQPFAQQAADVLRELLATTKTVGLRYDAESKDHYGRSLAHLFLDNGQSVEAALLERGLATVLVVPPNAWNLNCYRAVEKRARTARSGIWALPAYQAVDSSTLSATARGFHIIKGRVLNVNQARDTIWLELAGNLSLRIDHKDLRYFAGHDLARMKGHHVVARGWLKHQKEGLVIKIRHPAALEWLP